MLFNPDNPENTAPVILAAQTADAFDADEWPYAGHVTGAQNKNVYMDYSDEIEALAKAQDLVVEPNYMGTKLAQLDDTPSAGM